MSKNHMAEVAKIFGVELGEPFKITSGIQDDYQSYYRFTESSGIEISDDGITWKMTSVATLLKYLLMGDIRIIKLPWNHGKVRNITCHVLLSDLMIGITVITGTTAVLI